MSVNYLSLQGTMHGRVKKWEEKFETQVIKQQRQGRKNIETVPVKKERS